MWNHRASRNISTIHISEKLITECKTQTLTTLPTDFLFYSAQNLNLVVRRTLNVYLWSNFERGIERVFVDHCLNVDRLRIGKLKNCNFRIWTCIKEDLGFWMLFDLPSTKPLPWINTNNFNISIEHANSQSLQPNIYNLQSLDKVQHRGTDQ